MTTYRKKLIEVALPLDAINKESAREKSIRHGHPSTLHLWWARRPLAACRAVLFASLIDDPSENPDLTEEQQDAERKRLFDLIEDMVKWEKANDEKFMDTIRAEVRKATGDNPPPVLDPFAGGGSIPLEAQRLGLEAHASDLNPVAVLINKALIELPPKFANMPPINPEAQETLFNREWRGAQGLAEDIRYYGKWMRDEAEKRIGHLYPKVKLLNSNSDENEATVIAWIWARTVKCPNPACGAQMPLVRSFLLSKKSNTYVEPHVDYMVTPPTIQFSVETDGDEPQDGTVNRQGARCIACGISVPFDYIRDEAKTDRMGNQLMAIVAEGKKGRVYLAPNDYHILVAKQAHPTDVPETNLPEKALGFRVQVYGMTRHRDLFTQRQLVALTTLSDLVQEVRLCALNDARSCQSFSSATSSDYANALTTYLGIAVSKSANTLCSLAVWSQSRDQSVNVFSRQALPMNWDFPEVNPFAGAAGDFSETCLSISKSIVAFSATNYSYARQQDAITISDSNNSILISTDPPYYDNIGYADLSDFFYIWLRRSLNHLYAELFSTVLVPKAQELIATPYRFGGNKRKAQNFFERGLNEAFVRMRSVQLSDYPLTIYYAFKQAESDANDEESDERGNQVVASTGWETMLEGLVRSGFTITGTWPMRTERPTGVKVGTNALASSIVLVCRPRPVDARSIGRRQFINELRAELADALKKMQKGTIAPVDLAQASIGPGMAIYSRYKSVLESDGTPLSIRTALQLINRELDSVLADQEGEYDLETRWAVAWFEEYALGEGQYGRAEVLSKAKNTAIQAMVDAGIVEARAGWVRLKRRDELGEEWKPQQGRVTAWEVMQRMLHGLDKEGELGAAKVMMQVPAEYADVVRDLAYRLYNICERKGWAQEALYYNMLVAAWSGIDDRAREVVGQPQQTVLSFE